MIMMTRFTFFLALGYLVAAPGMARAGTPAAADPALLSELTISLGAAMDAAEAAVAFCRARGWQVTATVVGRTGRVKVVARADGAGPHTLDSSRRKAYTAASLGMGTDAAEAIARKDPAAVSLRDIDGFLLLGGGLPIKAGGAVVGAIGVGGAPGGNKDAACARAGIVRIGDRLAP